MEWPVPQFEVIGAIPDGAMAALARMLLDAAERELTNAIESPAQPSQNERAAGELGTTPAALTDNPPVKEVSHGYTPF